MKKKVYEVPAILVYKTAPTMPLCNSGGDIEDWARGTSWFDAEEFDAEEFDEDKFEDKFEEDEENY